MSPTPKEKRKLSDCADQDDSLIPIQMDKISSSATKIKKYSIDALLQDHKNKRPTNIWDRIQQIKQQETTCSSQEAVEKQPTIQETYEDLVKFQWSNGDSHGILHSKPKLDNEDGTAYLIEALSQSDSQSNPFLADGHLNARADLDEFSSQPVIKNAFEIAFDFINRHPLAANRFAATLALNCEFVAGWIEFLKQPHADVENACYACWKLASKCKTFDHIEPTDGLLFDLFQMLLMHDAATRWCHLAIVKLCQEISFTTLQYSTCINRFATAFPACIDTCLSTLKQVNANTSRLVSQQLLQQFVKNPTNAVLYMKECKLAKRYPEILLVSILLYHSNEPGKPTKEKTEFIRQVKEFESGLGVFDKESLTTSKDFLFQLTCEYMNVAGAYNCKKNPLQTK